MATLPFDRTAELLEALDPYLAERARFLINGLRELGIPAGITALGGRRTLSEQQRLIGLGRSNLLRSAHLQGRAFDLDILGMPRDEVPAEFWNILGPWCEENLGLRWGGRWTSPYDPGHFEI